MTSVDELTAALPGDDPCGEDLSMSSSLLELDTLIKGKAETQFSGAEPPDWRKVRQSCLELFGRSRDLRVSVALCLALMCTEGLGGLRDGLTVLRHLLQKYWPTLHPKLDPEDNHDPLQRMNTLAVISAPLGTRGDPFRFLENLGAIPLTNSRQIGRFTVTAILEARAVGKGASRTSGLDAAQIEAAFRDTPALELQLAYENAVAAAQELNAIGAFLRLTVGAVNSPDLTALEQSLFTICELILPYVNASQSSSRVESTPRPASARAASGSNGTGPIASRDDVLRVLEQVREFYASHEPASPIPLLIHRIERMVPMTFLQILQEMAPESVNQINTIIGPQASPSTQ